MNTRTRHAQLVWMVALSMLSAAIGRPSVGAEEQLPAGLRVVAVHAYPEQIQLTHRFDYRQVLLTGQLESGETVDLTRMAKLMSAPTTVAVSPDGVVRPVQDGRAQLVFAYLDQSISIPVQVDGAQAKRPVSFVQDVQPAFSRMGCNSGTCHGSKDGKDGFKLSLRGYDPLFDHRAFTDDIGARRINRAAPDQSLMLLKTTGSIPHVGGVRTKVGDPYYELVREWIMEGCKLDMESPRVASLDILPRNPVLPRAGMKQQMVVLATYADGSVRDVSGEAFIESGDIEILAASDSGQLTLLRRGEAPVLVRYEGAYAATTLTVMGNRDGFVWKRPPANNYIDEHVYDKLARVKILPSGICTDEEFVRRLYVDLTGLPPTANQVREFLADPSDNKSKRDRLVDELVGGVEFVEHWTNKWADLLQVNRKFLGEEGAVALRNWIKHNVATNRPYDQFAYEVLTASGSNFENPPAAYYKVLRDPAIAMENTTHLFLAVRFNCNKCHDHPFERWTQDQYYRLASYFAQIGRKQDPLFAGKKIGGSAVMGALPLVEVIYDIGTGEVKHDRTGEVTPPAFPFMHDDLAPNSASRREQLARWITSPKNQYFALSYVNRLWGYLLGVGIINPIDDIRAGNPPTNPELLDSLTRDFIDSGFDAQRMLRTMCKSRTYQYSIQTNPWNEDDTINYSHAIPRRLPAEVLYDAIHLATGSMPQIPGVPVGFRAAQLPDNGVRIPFLDDFGRPVRESSCECERSSGIVLGPIMRLVNGPTVANAIADEKNALTKLVNEEKDDRKLITEVFIRFLARHPTDEEVQLGLDAIASVGEGHGALVDQLEEYEKQLPTQQAAWEAEAGHVIEWTVLESTELKSEMGGTFAKQDDESVLVSGKNGKDVYTIVTPTQLTGITGVRLEVLPDPSLPQGGPGRAPNGNFVLSELQLTVAPRAEPDKAIAVKLRNATADFSQQGWGVTGAVDRNETTGWAVMPEVGKQHQAVFESSQDLAIDGSSILTFTLRQQHDMTHTLGRFRLSATTSKRPVGLDRLPENVLASLAVARDQRSGEQRKVLTDYYRSLDSELARLQSAVQQSEDQMTNKRLIGVQDLAWALINSPAFLFNR